MTPENQRLDEVQKGIPWMKWGPYLSERQWGTVREDYSDNGDAWNYFSHDQARFRAYRWGEDGLAGFCDDSQQLCFALALWNGKDPILKERLFGLTNDEGNHGEDVKEYYFYLDSTPTYSYLKYLYKYPQAAYPYAQLLESNRARGKNEAEYELLDTGIFDDDRYFDVFVEYAKADPEDILIRITIHNRGRDAAELQLLPTLWFRNTWSWGNGGDKPTLGAAEAGAAEPVVVARHATLSERFLYCPGAAELLFTENETNSQRVFGRPNAGPYVKDGIDRYIVSGEQAAVNPQRVGTKVAALCRLKLPAGGSEVIRLRLSERGPEKWPDANRFGRAFDDLFALRQTEADGFYAGITASSLTDDKARVMRQALAGMLWTKQFYYYDVALWLRDHGDKPEEGIRARGRNCDWFHMYNADVISMPDKWEYPWYAAWDLAFHTVPLSLVDVEFAKRQLMLLLGHHYLHPNGQIPAYEYNFGDVSPPVHCFAVWFVYQYDKLLRGGWGDLDFLKFCFQKLLLNFTWWVNRKDPEDKNVFAGGFLGLDNIGVFDRSSPLPTGGHLEQSDGTTWMAIFAAQMLQIAVELAVEADPVYESMALKFFEHFLWIASAMDNLGVSGVKLWNHEDGFYYDVLRFPDGGGVPLKVRSMVGLLPLAATTVLRSDLDKRLPRFFEQARWFLEKHPHTAAIVTTPLDVGAGGNRILSLLNSDKVRRILGYMLNEKEFLSNYGIRSLSHHHHEHPYVFSVGQQEYRVAYVPGESENSMFGGNSNWRGPIWMPMQVMLLSGLTNLYAHYGDDLKVECPVGSGRSLNLFQVSHEIADRLTRLFLVNSEGRRPSFGAHAKWSDPHWRDHLQFYEYFHGDTGAGLGASHQTGWTGVVAFLLHSLGGVGAEQVLEKGLGAAVEQSVEVVQEAAGTQVAAQVAEEVHEQVTEEVLEKVVELVQEKVAEAVEQHGAETVQEKVAEIVMEKVSEAVQKKVEQANQPADGTSDEGAKDIL
jgi:hypothetical protein